MALGASFLVRFERERVPARVAVGLVMIFFAALVLLALFTPWSERERPARLFARGELTARGGYVGAGVAWVGLSLFGQVVSCIIMVGVVLRAWRSSGFPSRASSSACRTRGGAPSATRMTTSWRRPPSPA